MPSAEELHDRYKEKLVDENLGNELLPQVYSKGLLEVNHNEVVRPDGEVDRETLQHMMMHIKNPIDQQHQWMVFGATVNVRQAEGEDPEDVYDREAMRGDDPESSEMFMIQVVTPSETVNWLYDNVTGELYEKIAKDGDNMKGDLVA